MAAQALSVSWVDRLVVKVSPVSGEQGEVPSVPSHWADTEPSHDKHFLEVQDEDGEKSSPWLSSGSRCRAGAQAADLPVKAKPVQYVKICTLYGVGFYYIPGTDMCIKIGGWVRAEYHYGDNGN